MNCNCLIFSHVNLLFVLAYQQSDAAATAAMLAPAAESALVGLVAREHPQRAGLLEQDALPIRRLQLRKASSCVHACAALA